MQNVKMRLDGDTLHIEIDIKQKLYDTQKAEMVATTSGWVPLHEFAHGELAVSLNLTRKRGGRVYHNKSEVV
jgi:hypothetical protein